MEFYKTIQIGADVKDELVEAGLIVSGNTVCLFVEGDDQGNIEYVTATDADAISLDNQRAWFGGCGLEVKGAWWLPDFSSEIENFLAAEKMNAAEDAHDRRTIG